MDPAALSFSLATERDVPAIVVLRTAVADRLTLEHGRGHWSTAVTENGVRQAVATSRVLLARLEGAIVGTLRLATKKPWAIDVSYFTPARRPLYLIDMAVTPELQRRGIGWRLLAHALEVAAAWPADAVRLDAYDAPAGAGGFYARCGWRERGRVTYRDVPLIYFERVLTGPPAG